MNAQIIVPTLVAALASFFVCGIPFGMIIAARMAGIDIRQAGSGNIGMTNVARTAGGKAAALTLLCDAGKGAACMFLFRWLLGSFVSYEGAPLSEAMGVGQPLDWIPALLYLSCVFGHVFSPYLKFHGGKGISVGFGAALGMWWPVGLGLLAVFLIVTLPTHIVSAGSLAAAASLPIQCALWHMSLPAVALNVAVAVVVIWSHRENIGRLVRGEEGGFSVHHKEDDE